jgi:hypothetical protein
MKTFWLSVLGIIVLALLIAGLADSPPREPAKPAMDKLVALQMELLKRDNMAAIAAAAPQPQPRYSIMDTSLDPVISQTIEYVEAPKLKPLPLFKLTMTERIIPPQPQTIPTHYTPSAEEWAEMEAEAAINDIRKEAADALEDVRQEQADAHQELLEEQRQQAVRMRFVVEELQYEREAMERDLQDQIDYQQRQIRNQEFEADLREQRRRQEDFARPLRPGEVRIHGPRR